MKEQFTEPKNYHNTTLELFTPIISILDSYQHQGLQVTLRQLYYQLVTKNIIKNQKNMYQKVGKLVKEGRMCGWIDWDVIEDRIRKPIMHSQWENIQHLLSSAAHSYRKDRHEEQRNYVEVWTEKDALSNIFAPITAEYHVHLIVSRGYNSTTAMYDTSLRFKEAQESGKNCYILYLGDHDPSGMDMIRDIDERIQEYGLSINVKPISLTMEQIRNYNLPPNFAKLSDTRVKKYIKRFGKSSWELDALEPTVLHNLLRENIENLIDMEKYNRIIVQEESEKKRILNL